MQIETTEMDQVLRALIAGDVVGLPTETVYGLAANAYDNKAIAKIYALKNRPTFNPLIVHVASLDAVQKLVDLSPDAKRLAAAFWPGPLTLVLKLPSQTPLGSLLRAGLDTVAIRVPKHPFMCSVLERLPFPLAAPSANKSEDISPTTAAHVRAAFPDILVADGGPARVGLESTILDMSQDKPMLLRHGGIPLEDLEAFLGTPLEASLTPGVLKAPGQMKRHYAPKMPLRLNVLAPNPGCSYLGFGPMSSTLNLSETGDCTEAAANLFSMLHQLDFLGKPIDVAPIPFVGLGRAINDRLSRAAHP